jgi:hypothetical protein
MDMLNPARLVFHYERLMSLAFGMSARTSQRAAARRRPPEHELDLILDLLVDGLLQ